MLHLKQAVRRARFHSNQISLSCKVEENCQPLLLLTSTFDADVRKGKKKKGEKKKGK